MSVTAGLWVPEYAIRTAIVADTDRLNAGTFATQEVDVFRTGSVPAGVLTDFYASFVSRPVRVGFTFPAEEPQLPLVTLLPQDMMTDTAYLGEGAWEDGDTVETVTGEIVVASAAGGETTASLDNAPIVPNGQEVRFNGVPIAEGAGYTLNDATGVLTFSPGLLPGDVIEADYRYYADGRRIRGETSRYSTEVLVWSNHPQHAMLLSMILWRALQSRADTIETLGGLHHPAVSIAALSAWEEILPDIGFHRVLRVSGTLDQSYSQAVASPRSVDVQLDQGSTTVVSLTVQRDAS